jgi:DNA primase small subunit
MLRHQSFKNINELKVFLQKKVPSGVYFSCAYYNDPGADMDQKGWLGADLVFDIDADHIRTPCDRVHDKWGCGVCGMKGKGVTPSECPVCGSEKFEVSTWPCEVCLESAKTETVKLLEMLMNDFGFPEGEVCVFFSGHRGYHVHVENELVRTLDAMGRKEIVDYVSGIGLDVSYHGLSRKSLRITSSENHPISGFGWGRRLASGMREFILDAEEEDLKEVGLTKNVAAKIFSNRDEILEKWLSQGTLGAVRGLGVKNWEKIAKYIAELQSATIDTVVTTDLHRLIRLEGTLHGKTGLKKVEFPVSGIDDFDPFRSAVAFKRGAVTVFVLDAPEFRVGEEVFGPYKKQRVELPTAAAMLLVCKGRAEVAE